MGPGRQEGKHPEMQYQQLVKKGDYPAVLSMGAASVPMLCEDMGPRV